MLYLRQSTASQEVLLGPFLDETDGISPLTGLTIANTDIKLWKGGTSEANKNSGGATHIAAGRYYAVLDATDTDTVGGLEVNVHATGALPVKVRAHVLEEAVYDALYAASAVGYVANAPVNVAQWSGSNVASPASAGHPVVTIKVGTGAGEVNLSSGKAPATIAAGDIANNAITAAAIADNAIDRATFAPDTGLQTIRSNTAQAGSGNSITLDASASSQDNAYKGKRIIVTSGTGSVQDALCTAYDGTTKVATVTGWTLGTNPTSGSTFVITNDGGVLTERIRDYNDGEYYTLFLDATGAVTVGAIGGSIGNDLAFAFWTSTYASYAAINNTFGQLLGTTLPAELAKVPKSDGTATWNATALASINSQCDTALADYDGPTNAEMEARTLAAASYATSSAQTTAQNDLDILTGTDGVTLATSQPNYAPATSAQAIAIQGATFDTATDSLEALRNRGDAAWATATSVTVSDKTGFKLASDGLDQISATVPNGVPSTFVGKLLAIYSRFFHRVEKTSTTITTYRADATTPNVQQTISSSGSNQSQGAGGAP